MARHNAGAVTMRAIAVVALAATLKVAASVGGFPNACSKHGHCSGRQCICDNGYRGYDCSERRCAAGLAWASVPSGIDTAHTMAECSNAGICDRKSGACKCGQAFSGIACERMACPNACSDHGRCMSLSEAATSYDGHNLVQTTTYTAPWDAEKVYGCVCDWGWTGHSCALRVCPMGDDPMTTGQVDEVQTLTCTGNAGHFWLTYKTFTTDAIAWDATAATVKAAIDVLPSVGSVTVVFADVNEVQTITIGATGGTFDLAFGGQTTAAALTAPASAAAVQTALEGLSSIGGNVDEVQTLTVVATGGTFKIRFYGANGIGDTSSAITAPATADTVQTALESLNNIGASVDEVQTITAVGTSGTWDVTFDGQSTTGGALTAPATAAQVQAALEGLSNIAAGSIGTVTQATPTAGTIVYTVTFSGADMAGNQPQITATDVSLAGGTPSVASATTTVGSIGSVGTVTVNTATAGTSIYTITFTGTDVDGNVSPLSVPSNADMTGGTDEVQQVTVVATGGSFKLRFSGGIQTAAIAMPATADAVQTALEAHPYIGASVDAAQTIAIYATGGSFDLEFNGQTTAAAISAPATAATVQTALEGLSTIAAGSIGVTLDTSMTETSIYTVTFIGADLAGNVAQISVPSDAALTGGIDEVQTLQIHALGGTFDIEFSGQTTASSLTHPASAAAVQSALESLSNINVGSVGTVTVDASVADTSTYTVTFTGADVLGNVAALTVPSDAGLLDSDEIQLVIVAATSGTFDLNFGGHTTTTINVGASADTVQSALEGLSSIGASVDEVQTITIGATGGTFQISFDGQTTGAITAPASADTVQIALEALSNIGASVDEAQTITVVGTSGTWDVTFDGQSTTGGTLTAPATAAQVKAALEGLSNIAANGLTVTEATPTAGTRVYTVTFSDPTLAGNQAQITATNVALAGGTPSVASATTTVGTIGSVGTVTVNTATADTSIYTITFTGTDVTGDVVQMTVPSDVALTGGAQTSSTATTTPGSIGSVGTVTLDTSVASQYRYSVTFTGADVEGDVGMIYSPTKNLYVSGGGSSLTVQETRKGFVASSFVNSTVVAGRAPSSTVTTVVQGSIGSIGTVTVDTSTSGTSIYSITFTGTDVDGDTNLLSIPTDALLIGGVDEVQTITIGATGGTFDLAFDGQSTGTSGALTAPATAAAVQAALEGLSNIRPHIDEVQAVTIIATGGTFQIQYDGQLTGQQNAPLSAADFKTALEGLSNINAGSTTVTVDTSVAGTSTYSVTFTGSDVESDVPQIIIPTPLTASLIGGNDEVQVVTVVATGGYFNLIFEGKTTANIIMPATADTLQTALEGLSNIVASVDEVQTITVQGTSGTWDLLFDGQTTGAGGALTAPASAAAVKAALEGLSNIASGSVTVTVDTSVGYTSIYTVVFVGTDVAGDVAQITGTNKNLVGGHPGVASATTTVGTIGSVGTVTVDTSTAGTSVYTVTFTGDDVNGDRQLMSVPTLPAKDYYLTGGDDEVQTVTIGATGGTFQLHFAGQTTAAITAPASAHTVQLALEALSNINSGTDEVQTITIYATGGTFDLEFNGQTTAVALTAPASAAAVQAALEGLSTIPAGSIGTVTIDTSVAEHSKYTVTFTGSDLPGDQPQITVPSSAALTGGVDEIQTIMVKASGGTFTVKYDGQTSAALTAPLSAANMQAALEGLSNVGAGNVGTVTVNTATADTSTYTIVFTGTTATTNGDVPQIEVVTTANLLGRSETQTVTIGATGGTFQLAFNGQTTGAITAPASADTVQIALEALSNIGASVDEAQTITVVGTSGTWDVTFDGQSTTGGTLTAPATAAQVKAALEGLSNIAANGLTVTEATPTAGTRVYTVTFSDPTLAGNQAQITATNVALAGGTPSVASATTTVGTIGSVGTVTVNTATADTSIYTFTFGGSDVVGNVAQVTVVSDAALTGGTGTSSVATTVAGWVPDSSQATSTVGRLANGISETSAVGVLSSLGTVVLDTTVADTSQYTITFIGDDVNGDRAQMSVPSNAALTGGSQSSAVATTVPGTVARTSITETVTGTVARFSVATTAGGSASGCTVTVDTSVADTSIYSVTFTGDDLGSIVDGDVAQITVVSDAALTGGAGTSTVGTLTTGTVARTSVATTTVGVAAHAVVATTTAGRLSGVGTVTLDTSVADTSKYTVTFTGSGVEGNVGLISVPSDAALTGGTASSTIATVTVGSGSTVCTDAPGVSTSITFTNNGGDLPNLIVGQPLTGALALGVTETSKGTKESAPCSNHGICDTLTGRCVCEAGFVESNGMGARGMLRDCGHNDVAILNVTTCHGWDGSKGVCSTAGLCEDWSSGYTCSCFGSHKGFRCQERKCPVGRAWWDEPSGTNIAHARETECRCVLRCVRRAQARNWRRCCCCAPAFSHTDPRRAYVLSLTRPLVSVSLSPSPVCDCSNRGACDYSKGTCACDVGFTGPACNRLACDSDCSGIGRCRTLQQLGQLRTINGVSAPVTCVCSLPPSLPFNFFPNAPFRRVSSLFVSYIDDVRDDASDGSTKGISTVLTLPRRLLSSAPPSARAHPQTNRRYGSDPSNAQQWDFDMIQGCMCDTEYRMTDCDGKDVGMFNGYDCSLRTCRTGDFPDYAGAFEVQTVSCDASAGTFTLKFREHISSAIAYNANAAAIETAFEGLKSVANVTVTLGGVQTTACSGNFAITFNSELGNVPNIVVASTGLTLNSAVTLAETQAGTKDNIECAGLGVCGAFVVLRAHLHWRVCLRVCGGGLRCGVARFAASMYM